MEGHEPRHSGPEPLLGAILLLGGAQAGLGLPLRFSLHGVKTDISAGSINSPIRYQFLEKRIQVWLKELILYLLDKCMELSGVASAFCTPGKKLRPAFFQGTQH